MQLLAHTVDDVAALIGAERASPGKDVARLTAQDEEAAAVDRQIQCVVGERNVALGEVLRDLLQTHTAALLAGAAAPDRRRIDIRKLRTGRLEAIGTGVGNVVTGYRNLFLRRIQGAQTNVETHVVTSSARD